MIRRLRGKIKHMEVRELLALAALEKLQGVTDAG
jgi:hypothetical protein